MRTLTDTRLAWGFRRRGPWVSRFTINGRTYGGHLPYENDVRLRQFFEAFPDAKTILEPGCLEGALSVQLARRSGGHVTAVDSREENLDRARFVQKLFGVENVTFAQADLEQTPLDSFGRFDAVFCSGLIYHLSRPWEFIDGLRAASANVFIWTHYAYGDEVRDEANGYRGFWYGEKGLADPRSGMTPRSFFMTLPDLVERLRRNGFEDVDVIKDDPEHEPHACVTLAARAG